MHAGNDQRRRLARVFSIAALIVASSGVASGRCGELPEGYWTEDQAQRILSKTLRVHLAPPLDGLSVAERGTIQRLLKAGQIMQHLYEQSRHAEALTAQLELKRWHASQVNPGRTQALLDLYRLSKGPIVTSLDNVRLPFLPVAKETPGKNVYPLAIGKQELERFFLERPNQREALLGVRSITRRAVAENIRHDLAVLAEHPVLVVLHPGLREHLWALRSTPSPQSFYALPYSVAYADHILRVYEL